MANDVVRIPLMLAAALLAACGGSEGPASDVASSAPRATSASAAAAEATLALVPAAASEGNATVESPRAPPVTNAAIFVAPDGDDAAGDGSRSKPLATPMRAYQRASGGDVIVLRGGTYALTDYLMMTKVAAADRRITLMSYPGEWAILDFAEAPPKKRVWVDGARFNTLRDLEIRNSRAQGVFVLGNASHNDFINLVFRNPNGSGIQIFQGSRNRVFDSLAIFTRAPAVPGDADGFNSGGRGGPSEYNELHRCVAVNSPDDGFDTWEGYRTRIMNSWTIRAGRYGGDGNGFKTGPGPGAPNSVWPVPPPPNKKGRAEGLLRFNVAVDSAAAGFDSNSGSGNRYENNTAYRNQYQFSMYTPGSRVNFLTNNLAVGRNQLVDSFRERTNSWNLPKAFVATEKDLVSTQVPPDSAFEGLTGAQAYSLLASGSYRRLARLRMSSRAVDAGTDIGIAFSGLAPDLGAFEVK